MGPWSRSSFVGTGSTIKAVAPATKLRQGDTPSFASSTSAEVSTAQTVQPTWTPDGPGHYLSIIVETGGSRRRPGPDVSQAQATRPILAVSLMSATSAFSSRSASFLIITQVLPMLAFGSRSTYRSAT